MQKKQIYILLLILISLVAVFIKIKKQPTGLVVEIESNAKNIMLFFNSGNGFSEKEKMLASHYFFLPDKSIEQISIAPCISNSDSVFTITRLKISRLNKTFIELSDDQLLQYTTKLSNTGSFSLSGQNCNRPILLSLPAEQLHRFTSSPRIQQKKYLMYLLFSAILLILLRILWLLRKPINRFFDKINKLIDGTDSSDEIAAYNTKSNGISYKMINPFPSMKIYWVLFLLAAIIYIIFYTGINSYLITFAGHDDALYYHQANSISNMTWLGGYHSLTLAKMPGYALFLSVCIATGLPYLLFISICYSVAVAFFLHRTFWLFDRTKLLSFIMGVGLLYNPIFNSELRIYRNQLATMCFLIFMGSILSMFNPSTKKESRPIKLITALISFLGIGFLFYTREENILYYGILFLSAILFSFVFKKIKHIGRNLYPLLSGVLGIIIIGFSISLLNLICYGRFTTCERTSAPFTSAIHAFQMIDDPYLDPRYPKITTSPEKVMQVAEIIPEFKNVATILCDTSNHAFKTASTYLDKNDLHLKQSGKDCIPVSHFEWYWINSINMAGYYNSATTVASFYEQLTNKINDALKTGTLKKRTKLIPAGPYCIDKTDINTIFRILPKNYNNLLPWSKHFVSSFHLFAAKPVPSDVNSDIWLLEWSKKLHINYLHDNDNVKIDLARHSLKTKFWDTWVMIFAYFFIPLMHLATPLALLVIIVSLFRHKTPVTVGLIVVLASYISHFVLLSVVDVAVGFNASSIAYYLPSYNLILAASFISVAALFNGR